MTLQRVVMAVAQILGISDLPRNVDRTKRKGSRATVEQLVFEYCMIPSVMHDIDANFVHWASLGLGLEFKKGMIGKQNGCIDELHKDTLLCWSIANTVHFMRRT